MSSKLQLSNPTFPSFRSSTTSNCQPPYASKCAQVGRTCNLFYKEGWLLQEKERILIIWYRNQHTCELSGKPGHAITQFIQKSKEVRGSSIHPHPSSTQQWVWLLTLTNSLELGGEKKKKRKSSVDLVGDRRVCEHPKFLFWP